MSSPIDRALLVLGLFFATTAVGCEQAPVRTVPGPETAGLVYGFDGYIMMDRPVGGLVSIALPDLTET